MPTFSLNGKTLTVPPGTTILEAALTAGIEIPHYCYHPGLPVEGSCFTRSQGRAWKRYRSLVRAPTGQRSITLPE